MVSISRVVIIGLLLAAPASAQGRTDQPFLWDGLHGDKAAVPAPKADFPPEIVLSAKNDGSPGAPSKAPPVSAADLPAEGPLPESSENAVGYATAADALQGLRRKEGVRFSVQNGWTIATEEPAKTIWSFAPADHYGFPSVVRRQVLVKDGKTYVEMRVLCHADKSACDRMVREFNTMNEAIGASIRAKRGQARRSSSGV